MWAQMITLRLKPGTSDLLQELEQQLRAIEQPDSGLLHSMTMLDQKDPQRVVMLVVFDSEEKARAREQDPRRQEGLPKIQAMLRNICEEPPEFADLTVLADWTP